MRKLTKHEFDNKPSWANSYDIQAQSGEPIFYAEKDGGAMPINEKNVFESQQQEIADLKLAVQFQYNAAMTLDEENQIARKEINELKAMVNALRWAADLYHGGYKVSELEEANSLMVMSPGQCLKSVKADAVKDAAHRFKVAWPHHHGKFDYLIGLSIVIREGVK